MPEFSWQDFNQMEGGKPTNNSLRHSTSLIHPQMPSLLGSGGDRYPVEKKQTTTEYNCVDKNCTYWRVE